MPDSYLLKIVLIGEPGAGETSLRKRYMGSGFRAVYQKTIGVDIAHLELKREDYNSTLAFWDIAGDVEFAHIRTSYFSGTNTIIFVFDCTKTIDQEATKSWIEDISDLSSTAPLSMVLLLNKIDLKDQRVLEVKDLEPISDQIKEIGIFDAVNIFETSAKDGKGIEESLEWILDHLVMTIRKKKERMERIMDTGNYRYAQFLMKPHGPELLYHNFIEMDTDDIVDRLTLLGISYIAALGQGHSYSSGVFELPSGDIDGYKTFSFSHEISNSESEDTRYSRLYSVFSLFIKEEVAELMEIPQKTKDKLFDIQKTLRDITELTKAHVEQTFKRMIETIIESEC